MTDPCDDCRQGDCGDCWVMYDRLPNDEVRQTYLERISHEDFERGCPRSDED